MIHKTSCGAVVFIKNPELKYLLLHYPDAHWGFVKGKLESNENEKETVIRELEEETGILDSKFIKGFRERITYSYMRAGKTVNKEVIFFLIKTQTKKIRLSYEHSEYLWVQFSEAMKILKFYNSKNVLQKAHNFLRN